MRFSIQATPANSEISSKQVRAAHRAELDAIARYCRLTGYIAAAQIYLKDNFLLHESLKPEHIKDCLLGHWGTCPGINLIYAHLNCLIQHHDISLVLIAGAGQGIPAMLANLYLERTLQGVYPELTLDANGLENLIRGFSCSCSFPNQSCAGIPGAIHAGEELGYALAVAFGAVIDNPDLIVACVMSDAEAETGATAWDSYKLLDPAKSGAVLPILYLNGDKPSTSAIYDAMSDVELQQRFTGYGYQVRIVGSQQNHADKDSATQNAINLDADLYSSLDWAYREICSIQQAARSGQLTAQPKFPLLIVRSPQDWTGIQAMGEIQAFNRSHLMSAKEVKINPQQLQLLEDWLRSYKIEELFDLQGCPIREILNLCPQGEQRMGYHAHTSDEGVYKSLNLPNIFDFEMPIKAMFHSHKEEQFSNTEQIEKYIKTVIDQNLRTFRIFCPDELESSTLSAGLEISHSSDQGAIPSDNLQVSLRKERILEFLSQHTCQGWLQGYLLTGRHGLYLSHEASLNSIISLINQHARFLHLSKTFPWRSSVASLNYLAISTPWQQECSDFSPRNSSFINAVLTQKSEIVRVYLPPDTNCLITTIAHCLSTTDQVNLIIASPNPMPQWLTMTEEIAHCRTGASIWHGASTDEGINPDVVLVGIGDRSTVEVMAAAQILRDEMPELRVRVVNVTDLRVLEEDAENSQHLDKEMFEALFTRDRPVIINFYGPLAVLKQLLFGRPKPDRFQLNGDRGDVIPSFAQNLRHGTSRFHLLIQAIRLAAPRNPTVAARASERVHYYRQVLAERYRLSQKSGGDRASPNGWM
jgi:xylulose-5-phosphate/fructose-6-phosphate phosphoketolase